MTVKRVSSGKTTGPTTSSTVARSSAPTKAFSVQAPAGACMTVPAESIEPAPLSERVIESTRHLQGLGASDLQMIQETLADKLEHDPQFIELVHQAEGGSKA